MSLGHRDRLKAKRQADLAAARLDTSGVPRSEHITLHELFDIYLGEVTPQKSERSRKHDRCAAELFLRCFGPGRRAKDLSLRDQERFIRERRSGRLRPSGTFRPSPVRERTIARDLKWLHAVLNWATLAGDGRGNSLLDRNPLKGLPLPSEKSPRRPIVSHERYEAMLEAARRMDWRFKVALVLAHETGHRIGAIRMLRWSDVDLADAEVRWRSQNDKTGYEHATPLTDAAVQALEAARRHHPGIGDAWVFPAPGDSSQPCSRHLFRDWWRRCERLAGLEHVAGLGWHGLRRKFATELKEMPLRDLCALGGWKAPQTVLSCYQQPDEGTMRRALEGRRRLRTGTLE